MIFIVTLFISIHSVFSQTSTSLCILDIRPSSSANNSNCIAGNWGGFLNNSCCGLAFNSYLYALGQRANQTNHIFLNSTEQNDCLASMKSMEGDVLSCGFEKLISGAGGCSDYSVTDVVNKLGHRLQSLSEDCNLLGMDNQSDKVCSACLRRWEKMGDLSNNSKDLMEFEGEICRFAVLVSMTSSRIDDERWVQSVYKCLGEQSLPMASSADDHGVKVGKNIKTGLWILIGGLVGITILVILASWILYRRSIKAKLPKEKSESNYSFSKGSSSLMIPIKEVYSATNNLSAANIIGYGMTGSVYKGILSNGQHVAVKHILDDGHMETFLREVTSLSHIRHPNLVSFARPL
ncbi:hypothetical protein F0562_033642 [Nyssa sinensis]|uniref:Protein kinase domain-containing protein n=1 Tax=Nyssa sinensis TaxID=561372 RepID=A0A5J5AH58_9ASTE|nr:hypothetical protein F0562_033642 [Nyssa sinensis]